MNILVKDGETYIPCKTWLYGDLNSYQSDERLPLLCADEKRAGVFGHVLKWTGGYYQKKRWLPQHLAADLTSEILLAKYSHDYKDRPIYIVYDRIDKDDYPIANPEYPDHTYMAHTGMDEAFARLSIVNL